MIYGINSGLNGMKAGIKKVGTASHNLSNLNTNSFKSLETVQLETKHSGVIVSTRQNHGAGSFETTGNPLHAAINGDGFFKVTTPEGKTGFTRNGAFQKDSRGRLTDAKGNILKPEIFLPNDSNSVTIGSDGSVKTTVDGKTRDIGNIELARFINPDGLTEDNGIFFETAASGAPFSGTPSAGGFGPILQGSFESSNSDLTKELVNTITGKHGFSANAKVVKTTDEMLGTVLDIKS